MTTLLSSPLPPRLDLDDWDALGETDERLELVDGYVIVVPSETPLNARAAVRLSSLLERHVGSSLLTFTHLDVSLAPAPATIRCPDVLVATPQVLASEARRAPSNQVVLAAEIVSPSSVETDWLTKRREYAAAGIPHYVVVDLRDGHRRITLFRSPGPDGYTDITGGTHVTLTLGEHPFTIGLADLVDAPR
ncbi:Uma2 family endonuclease [Mobilicoccus massiliensis]|uniref:Uma2 family endonuclease n=1 Tax=Mobilicoccus massiliensis TaxID=1522310 RepID=UPI0006943550|nr:Uma2 family endonuclease [Mobilicoccus massiliensis]